MRTVFALALTLAVLRGPAARGAAEAATSTLANESHTKAQTYEVLRERVRTEPLRDVTYTWFDQLFTARRIGGCLWAVTPLNDPADPRTLEKNFGEWALTARASLLLAYGALMTEPRAPCQYVGLPEGQIRSLRAHADADRVRIAQIVHAGGYAASWQPFVVAYRKWLQSAETSLPAGDTAEDNMKTIAPLAQLARNQRMFQLVREVPIDPGDVVNEMLRLVSDWRRSQGLPSETTDHGPNLFYVCDSGATSVHVRPWHSLAPAFFRAWEAADKKRDDPQALLIMMKFDEISNDIKSWAVSHADADWSTRDRRLNEMAKSRGLYSLLEK